MRKKQTQKPVLSSHVGFKSLLKAIGIAYLVTIPLFVIFAIILSYTTFPEKFISPVVIITTIISIVVAGSISTRHVRNKGWLNGGIVGFVYMLILYLLSSLAFNNYSIDRRVLTLLIIGIISGAIGGIIGINIGHSRNRRREIFE